MKKIFTLFLAVCYCFLGFADDLTGSWVVSNEGKIDVKKISFRESRTVVILENGQKLNIPADQIKSYSINGKVFKRLPLYVNGNITEQMVFMELVKNQDNMELYRFNTSSYSSNSRYVCFMLFKGDQLVYEYDEKSHRCSLNKLH
jgi:hypothetical protein